MTTATPEAAEAAFDALRARQAADAAVSAARAANGEAYREVLVGKTAAGVWFDRIKATPRAGKEWMKGVARTFHLDATGEVLSDMGHWLLDKLRPLWKFLKGFGLSNALGIVLTTPLRHQVVPVVRTAIYVLATPLRWAWGAVSWLLNKFTPTAMAVAAVDSALVAADNFVMSYLDEGIAWLDLHHNHGAMSWLRWWFQARTARYVIGLVFPSFPWWAVYAISLTLGTYGEELNPEEEKAVSKAKDVLAKKPVAQTRAESLVHGAETVAKAAEAAAAAVTADPAPEVFASTRAPRRPGDPYMRTEIATLTDTERKHEPGGGTFEAWSFVDEKGVRRIRMGDSDQLLLVEDLPDTVILVGTRQGGGPLLQDQEAFLAEEQRKLDLEIQVRTAQATVGGKPPTVAPSRGGRRATGNGRSKAASTSR